MTFEEPCFQVPRRCENERAKRKRLQLEKNSLKQTSMEGTLATDPWYKNTFVWIVTSSEVNHNNKINKSPNRKNRLYI